MWKIITLLSMISLASCRTSFVCSELKKQEINHVEMCDISLTFERCRCRLFDVNSWNAVSPAQDYPLSYCDGIAGFKLDPDITLEIRPKVKAMHRLKENLCQ